MSKSGSKLYHAFILKANDSHSWEKDVAENPAETDESVPSLFEEFITSWDCDGPVRIYRSRSIVRRTIWIILWTFMLCYGSYQCYNTYQEYKKHEKTVFIDIVDVDSMEFPAVTFCSLSPFSPESDNWYTNTDWHSFVDFQELYGSSPDDGKCASLAYADGTSSDNVTEPFDASHSTTSFDGTATTVTSESESSSTNIETTLATTTTSARMLNTTSTPVSSGRRRRSMKNDPEELEYTDFMYSEMRSNNFDGFDLKRSRRDTSLLLEARVFPNVSSTDLLNIRINCSTIFQRLLFTYNLANGIVQPSTLKYGDTSHCQNSVYKSTKEKLMADVLCWSPVVKDAFGYYSLYARTCNPVQITNINATNIQISSKCCQYSGTFPSVQTVEEYDSWVEWWNSNNTQKDELSAVVQRSQTSDGSDIGGEFSPSPEDIESSTAPVYKIILTCSFDQTSCSTEDFQEWNNNQYGRCYTFNSAFQFNQSNIMLNKLKPRQTRQFGPKNGLRLTLDIKSKYILSLLAPEVGLRVVFHKSDVLPFPEDEGINVLPGVSTSIQVSASEIKRLQPPWGKCAAVDDWAPKYNYSRTACRKVCLEQQYRNTCNCFVGFSPAYSNLTKPADLPQCSIFNITQKFCMDNILFNYYQANLDCNCPLSCDEWSYTPSVSTSMSNTKYYQIVQAIKGTSLGDDICSGTGNSTIRMQVYLNDLSYELLKENEAYSLETLVANIGGSMGLFVGVSIISCLELLEFLLNVILFYIKNTLYKSKEKKLKARRSHVYILHEQIGDQELGFPTVNQKPMLLSSFLYK